MNGFELQRIAFDVRLLCSNRQAESLRLVNEEIKGDGSCQAFCLAMDGYMRMTLKACYFPHLSPANILPFFPSKRNLFPRSS
jgi:hypothetical protein